MLCKYKEIFQLKTMLDKDNIPYEFYNHCFLNNEKYVESWQIIVPSITNKVISVIESDGSYGNQKDLLEIQGLLTEKEKKYDCVVGYLTADDVFKRIKKYNKKIDGKW